MQTRILVWDVPTRVFHWSLALSFAGAYVTAETERYRDVHLALGYVFLGLILFRLVWGLLGTDYARFSAFWFSPSAVISYLRSLGGSQPQHFVGHNPAGALAIFLLLVLGLLIGSSGVLLYWEYGGEWGEELFEEAHEIASNLMLLVVVVHIAGVFASSFLHRENLARAMLTGYKQGEAPSIGQTYGWLGVLMLVIMVGFLYFYLA